MVEGVGADRTAREGGLGLPAAFPQRGILHQVRMLADQILEALRQARFGHLVDDFRAQVVAGAALLEHADLQREQGQQTREQQQHEGDDEHGARRGAAGLCVE